jgi:hypothetical protein
MRMPAVLLALCFGAAILAAQDVRIDETGKTPIAAKFAAGGQVKMDLCPGDIQLVGSDDSTVRVSYRPERDDVRVRLQISGDHATLKIGECPHNNFHVRIELPKSSGLYVRMFAGQLGVRDIIGDKDVELSFGQMSVDVGKPEDYGRVDGSVNSGAIAASAFDVNKGGLFRSFEKSGPGKYRLHAHVGAGEMDLR